MSAMRRGVVTCGYKREGSMQNHHLGGLKPKTADSKPAWDG